jgi:hypothetical protein
MCAALRLRLACFARTGFAIVADDFDTIGLGFDMYSVILDSGMSSKIGVATLKPRALAASQLRWLQAPDRRSSGTAHRAD